MFFEKNFYFRNRSSCRIKAQTEEKPNASHSRLMLRASTTTGSTSAAPTPKGKHSRHSHTQNAAAQNLFSFILFLPLSPVCVHYSAGGMSKRRERWFRSDENIQNNFDLSVHCWVPIVGWGYNPTDQVMKVGQPARTQCLRPVSASVGS